MRESFACGGLVFCTKFAGSECGSCKRTFIAGNDKETFELGAATILALAGIQSADALVLMRTATRLDRLALATTLGTDEACVGSWEEGRVPISPRHAAGLRVLVFEAASKGVTDLVESMREQLAQMSGEREVFIVVPSAKR